MPKKTIFIASDIGNNNEIVDIKNYIIKLLEKFPVIVKDEGSFIDYPEAAKAVTQQVNKSDFHEGILICGSGIGMQIAANRNKNIRAAFCYDPYSAQMAKHDNKANVLTLRARNFNQKAYQGILDAWFSSKFSQLERHKRRVNQLSK